MAMMLVTCRERDERTGLVETLVSHGVDLDTGKTVVTDGETLACWKIRGATFDKDMGEWIIGAPAQAQA